MVKKEHICGILLICVLVCWGCDGNKKKKEVKATPDDLMKAKLLKRVDARFSDPVAHFELGKLYQKEGMWIEAEQEYSTALNFDPVYRAAQAARAKMLLAAGDNAKATMLAEEYFGQVVNSDHGSLVLGLAFQDEELDDYALRCFEQALRLNPTSAKVNRQIGYYYLSKNDLVRARDYLSQSFRLDRYQPDVARKLGELGVVIKRTEKAKKTPKQLDNVVSEHDKAISEKK